MTSTNPIEQAERDLRRDREDLKRLKKRYPGFDFLPIRNGVSHAPTAPQVQQTSMRLPSALEQAILDEMAPDPLREWTSRSMVEALRKGTMYRLADNDDAAMNAVALGLVSLKDIGKIERTHEGRGRDPHRYVVLQPIEKEEAPEETTS